MRQIILTAALIALASSGLASQAHAAARIPAPVTTAVQLTGGLGHAARPALPRDAQVAQIAPVRSE